MKLRVLELKDADGILEWMKDDEINRYFRFDPSKISRESVEGFINNSIGDDNKHFAIAGDDDIYLGTVSLKVIDYINKNAEYAISLRKSAIGTGAAAFATREILKTAFCDLKLNKVYLNVLSSNTRAVNFYKKMGFIFEGTFKKHLYLREQFVDIEWYSIFSE